MEHPQFAPSAKDAKRFQDLLDRKLGQESVMEHPTNIVDLDTMIFDAIVAMRNWDQSGDGFSDATWESLRHLEVKPSALAQDDVVNKALIKSVEAMLEAANVRTTQCWDIVTQCVYDYMDAFQSQSERRCVIRRAFTEIKEIISTLTSTNGGKSVEDLVEEIRIQMANDPTGYGAGTPITLAP